MSELLGYQYVVLRCVARPEREEFVNVGVVLYSQRGEFLDVAFEVDETRLRALSPALDVPALQRSLEAVRAACRGEGGPHLSSLGQRFGWLSAPRSTVVQPGPVHGGVTRDPGAELRRLLASFVG
ncbi:DUF3037 domain-containing protein [Segeticoccus rhizosphaerae]|uniref:DUF3037 domain-containing protein n=1 Tax=Segeticoccus rhizosphaerae TaxID=1104777 RepID=UPI001264AA8D|nr:DUF3037 domain-containing protein [Segeticoccus rhizosphaerae]